jgi:DNA-binding IclR family transcriptional regulator
VRKHAATLVREVAKHTPELAQLVVANGGVAALVE